MERTDPIPSQHHYDPSSAGFFVRLCVQGEVRYERDSLQGLKGCCVRGLSGYSYPKVPRAHPQTTGSESSGLQYTIDQPPASKVEMTDWPTEWDMEGETHDAWAVGERQPRGLHFTPKVAPSFDGRISWFAFEEAIDDW